VIFLRNPPAGMATLNSLDVFDHMEAECNLHLAREPQYPLCARSLAEVFVKVGDQARAARWLARFNQP
jgi:hypothetical protein